MLACFYIWCFPHMSMEADIQGKETTFSFITFIKIAWAKWESKRFCLGEITQGQSYKVQAAGVHYDVLVVFQCSSQTLCPWFLCSSVNWFIQLVWCKRVLISAYMMMCLSLSLFAREENNPVILEMRDKSTLVYRVCCIQLLNTICVQIGYYHFGRGCLYFASKASFLFALLPILDFGQEMAFGKQKVFQLKCNPSSSKSFEHSPYLCICS